jgi:hypothetical protein
MTDFSVETDSNLSNNQMKNHIEKAWKIYESLNKPKYICAPVII